MSRDYVLPKSNNKYKHCRAVSSSFCCRIFREILSLELPSQSSVIVSMFCFGQGTSPSNASLDSDENEYLVGQICCVNAAEAS